MAERIDPDMLKNLDLLLSMDVVESEAEWDMVEDMEDVEHASHESDAAPAEEKKNE